MLAGVIASADTDLLNACDVLIAKDKAVMHLRTAAESAPTPIKKEAMRRRADAAGIGRDDYITRVTETVATTEDGWRAKARVIAQLWDNYPPADAELAWSLVQDLVR